MLEKQSGKVNNFYTFPSCSYLKEVKNLYYMPK